ncbi:TetR/AcrR family transcriptional regulator [Actinoplanes sp. TBRC 11911]|uniref:TetR family transcriptional regulator n=1 Tax=Actinoplanes sp. TBRC 11911 TaxID=2729386 RepID=UPI00145F17C1|nr:TetR family transcriptional regulator [Actinoplanes sp. TBRC 11911]NMO56443.1 TetR/AcrR family transcriptional regulator [Actinoplanes sp. TBRC 11911]
MARSVEQTKERIVDAATVEFSEHGIAGARVDRIVARAGCGKGLVYNYFGNKEQLFDVVYDRLVTQAVEAVEFTADDLPGYAVGLHEYNRRHPLVSRLTTWFQLERASRTAPAVSESVRHKSTAVAAAQADGKIDPAIPAATLMDMIVAIAMLGDPDPDSVRLAVGKLVAVTP